MSPAKTKKERVLDDISALKRDWCMLRVTKFFDCCYNCPLRIDGSVRSCVLNEFKNHVEECCVDDLNEFRR